MNDFDFKKIDRELEQELNNIFDWNPRITDEEAPPEFILIPIGEYNGVDLPDCIIDENYIIWLKIPNPELNCEIIQY
jgi:hypothetical protein